MAAKNSFSLSTGMLNTYMLADYAPASSYPGSVDSCVSAGTEIVSDLHVEISKATLGYKC